MCHKEIDHHARFHVRTKDSNGHGRQLDSNLQLWLSYQARDWSGLCFGFDHGILISSTVTWAEWQTVRLNSPWWLMNPGYGLMMCSLLGRRGSRSWGSKGEGGRRTPTPTICSLITATALRGRGRGGAGLSILLPLQRQAGNRERKRPPATKSSQNRPDWTLVQRHIRCLKGFWFSLFFLTTHAEPQHLTF